VNDAGLTANCELSVAFRFGETLPAADWTHGRGVTVTVSGPSERFATVYVASGPGLASCSTTTGNIDSPPVSCAAAAPPAAAVCPSAAPPAPSAASTAPSAMYFFIEPSRTRNSSWTLRLLLYLRSTLTLMLTCERWPSLLVKRNLIVRDDL
jgi:hypothetical protein